MARTCCWPGWRRWSRRGCCCGAVEIVLGLMLGLYHNHDQKQKALVIVLIVEGRVQKKRQSNKMGRREMCWNWLFGDGFLSFSCANVLATKKNSVFLGIV